MSWLHGLLEFPKAVFLSWSNPLTIKIVLNSYYAILQTLSIFWLKLSVRLVYVRQTRVRAGGEQCQTELNVDKSKWDKVKRGYLKIG